MTTTMTAPPSAGGLGVLGVHPAAELFPLMDPDEYAALVADIRKNGLRQPIVRTPAGSLLDGRNRLRACEEAGVEPRFVVHRGDPWVFAIGANLPRRKLTHSQRAMIAAELADRPKGRTSNSASDRVHLPPTRKQAERLLGVSIGSLDRAKRVVRCGTPGLKELTATEGVQLTTAGRIALLPPEEQDAFVARVKEGADARALGSPAGVFGEAAASSAPSITRREARYRYVQEATLRVLIDSLDGLAMVLTGAEGLDPTLTPKQAAQWRSDLSRRAKTIRQLQVMLKERSG
jgi:hypothetical protein